MVDNPVPATAALLILALPGLWLAGLVLASRIVRKRSLVFLIAPALALTVWVLGLHVSGIMTGSFHSGLWFGTLVPAALGTIAYYRLRMHVVRGDAEWPSRWLWIAAAGVVLVLAPLAFRWAFHDELILTGHMSMTAAIQNGAYPPRYPSLPEFELRYHYGFPLLTAAVTSILRAPIDLGIDLITLVCGGYTYILLWALGDRILGNGRGWLTALLGFFGGGAPFVCAPVTNELAFRLLGYCTIDSITPNPPIVSYFFQHPFTIGLPLALTLMLIGTDEDLPRYRLPVIGMLLVALAFSQIVLFVMMVAALIASAAFADGLSGRRVMAMSVTCALALIVSTRLGGFFAPLPTGTSLPLIPQFGATPTILGSIIWNAASFGVLLPAGLAGLVLAGRWRAMLASLALGGLAVVNLVRYEHSWDIAKFGAVAALGLAIGASIAVNRLLELRPDRLARASAMAIVIAIVSASALLIFAFATVTPGIPEEAYGRGPAAYTVDEGRAMSWLRHHVRPGELVYRNVGQYHSFTQWAGLSEPRGDLMLERFGVPPSLTERRHRLVTTWPNDPDAFVSERIIWFVLRDDDSPAVQLTDAWLNRGRAGVRAEFGSLRIIELLADDTLALEQAR